MKLTYIVRPRPTTRKEMRWSVVGVETNHLYNQRHLTRDSALEQASTLAMISDQRFEDLQKEYQRRKTELRSELRADIDARSEKEPVDVQS